MHEPASTPIAFAPGDESTELIMPPHLAEDACPWCLGVSAGQDACFNCSENAQALGGFVERVIPVSLYSKPSILRDWLTFYKSDGEALADPIAGQAVGHIFSEFFRRNAAWINDLRIDGALVVPSTHRPPPHPLTILLTARGRLPFRMLAGLSRTDQELGHNRPNRSAFSVDQDLAGKRVILLDDVYTSGARAQSAAYALRSSGVSVAALCVLGRRYNPDYSEPTSNLFRHQKMTRFSWSVEARGVTRTSNA